MPVISAVSGPRAESVLTLAAPGTPIVPRYTEVAVRSIDRWAPTGWTGSVAYVSDPFKWVIHGERIVDDTPHVRVNLADVELPNHVRFTQYVFRMRRCAMTVVLDDAGERVLLMRRHRFIVTAGCGSCRAATWIDGEDSVTAAAREVEEETGWRPCKTEFVMSSQPLIGNARVCRGPDFHHP